MSDPEAAVASGAEAGAVVCRICGGDAREFLDLGDQPLSDTFVEPGSVEPGSVDPGAIELGAIEPEFFYRLRVCRCGECGMVQLVDEVPRDRMFTADYPFFTSSSARMSQHFTRTAERLHEEYCGGGDPFVIEIGANDGTMLAAFAERGVRHLGVDPAGLPGERAADRGVAMLHDFFEERTATQIRQEHGLADVIYAANTLCHIPYLDDVFRGIDTVLAPDGVFVFEDPYLGDIIRLTSFDQIYDEHFYFFSASSVDNAARRWGLELVDVERLAVHGGEVRYTLARRGRRPRTDAVDALVREELELGLGDLATFTDFAARVGDRRDRLVAQLRELREQGVRVAGYAATAKSATLLNFCGIDESLLPVVYDTTPEKQGRLTPGSHIPVAAFPEPADAPEVYLLLAWNHADEIIAKEQEFTRTGGRWLRYVPDVTLA